MLQVGETSFYYSYHSSLNISIINISNKLGGWYTMGLIIHQQTHRPSDSNKNEIVSADDAFMK